MKIEVTDLRNDRDDSFVATQLSTYNATFTVRDFRLLRVFARDTDGSIIGGLLADTYWQYLEVHKLWVSDPAQRKSANARTLVKTMLASFLVLSRHKLKAKRPSMMKKLAISAALLCWFSNSVAADWALMATTTSDDLYVDDSAITRIGDFVNIRAKSVFKRPLRFNHGIVAWQITHVSLNCRNRTSTAEQAAGYDIAGHVVVVAGHSTFAKPFSDSLTENMIEALCPKRDPEKLDQKR